MNEPLPEDTHELKAAWLGWAWVLPQLVLTLLNGQAWTLARGDMNHDQLVHAMMIGVYEAALLAFGIIAWVVLISRRKPIGIRLALAAIAVHTGYLWYVFQGIDHLLPSTVSIWMLPETEVVFYQFSLMMPVALVATTISSRGKPRLLIALPVIDSDSPSEYTLAVSKKLTPASKACFTKFVARSWPKPPRAFQNPCPPNVIVPRHISETYRPVRPSNR